MQEAPKVSILVPVYNVERYLRQCLDSLTHQTLREIEIICIDDNSVDRSMEIAQEISAADSRVKLLRHTENKGLSAARNTGILAASAPYIMFCDGDDFYAPQMCECMLHAIESAEGIDMAVCGTNIIYESCQELESSDLHYYAIKYRGVVNSCEEVFRRCNVAAWNKIFSKRLLNDWEIRFPEGLRFEDAFFYTSYVVQTRRIAFIQDKLYFYRRRKGSIMDAIYSKSANYNLDHLWVGEKVFRYMQQRGILEKNLHFIGWMYFSLIQSAMRCATRDEKNVIHELSESLLSKLGIDFSAYPDMAYARQLAKFNISLNTVRKKWFGLLRMKYKQFCVKYYFCGIPCGKGTRI